MIILIPVSVFFLASAFNVDKTYKKYYLENSKNVKIFTDKSVYSSDGSVTLVIANNSDRLIYFEPCEYLNNFEKKVNGVWVPVSKDENNKIYDKSGFNRKNNATECKIKLPQSGEGTYRINVPVYYDCQKPGKDMCQGSEIFYSNEFRIK
jgi:hypothetical protein